ncbi:MAG: ATP-binding cassette domain-containing protein [Cytophagales bacterium]|nr:ATP-binding cassette domain-containing protein [Cytophagales bacterium]
MINVTLINNLVEKYAELSGIKVNHFELFTEKGRHLKEYIDSLDQFFERIYDTGHYANFLFTTNSLPPNKFITTIKDISYPIIAFKKSDNIIPILITKEKNKYKAIAFEGEIYYDLSYKSAEELAKDLYRVVGLNWKFDFNYSSSNAQQNRNVQNDILFVTGLPVKPLLSNPTEPDEDTGKYERDDDDLHKNHVNPFKRLGRLMAIERKEISYIYFFAVLVGIVNLALPLGIQSIISLISGGMLLNAIVVLAIIMVLATAFAGYLQILQLQFVEILQQRVFTKAAYEFSFRIPKVRLESISRDYGPELVNRFFDVLNIQKSLPKFLIDMTAALLQILFGLILLSFYHAIFVIFGFLLITIIIIIFYYSWPRGIKSSITESKYKYKVAFWLEELARNATTFKLAGFTNLTIDKTDIYLSNYLNARQKHFSVLKTQYIAFIAFKTFITAGLLILGGLLVMENQINLGQFIAAELIIVLVLASVEKLIATLEVIYDLLTALDKVGHVTDLPLEDNKGIKLSTIPDYENFVIEMKNLDYQYIGAQNHVLKGVSFKMNAGEHVCVAGHNNSGKTTLIKIITGLLHNYSGSLTYNGIPMRDINIYSYRDGIGENISHDEIFEGTFEENITVGKKGISLDDLMWAVQKVGLSDFLKSLPYGLRTRLTGGGRDLSSNIRQKIILARSLAEKPSIVVMDDEFFTELNEKKNILDVLISEEHNWLLVMVSNDPYILERVDKVLYLNNGKIEAQGNYKTLIKTNKEFAELIIGEYLPPKTKI